jgi:small conductance mechanosensitive channel
MSADELITLGINVSVVVVLAAVGVFVARFIGRQVLKRIRVEGGGKEERRKQLETLVQLGRWVANITIITVALLMLLGNFVDIAPLLASLGAVGLAVSLGTQTLIKDFVGGLFILFEGQYSIGDVIQVGDVSGVVERLTLRATYVRDVSGKLYIVPNGEVRIVSNVTRDWSRALVDIGVAYEENLDRVIAVLEDVAETISGDPVYGPQLLERPQVLGPLSLGDWAITVRVMVKTKAGKQWGVALELRKRLLAACDREGITLPYPRQEVWLRKLGDVES